ncbi:hypothetical protein J8273_0006 [Carpediemonas membranifera]|uniref:Uncharacterized protein n=1 Tax=Carpediemonas membranifera TaxID=201153 RepID=A0A8J6E2V9_9EUKA|nr:hypothetical protein J8273_0006 [Carpediemonas membranifera]|eukprot:KAG9394811.1 hypothetical protein J8273_0006 [Carpediemonas membranifera]
MKTLTIDTPFAVERALQEYLSAMPHEKNPISFIRALSPETTEKLRAQWRPTTLFDTFEDLQRTVLSDSDARRAANTSSASTAARARTTKTDNLTAIWVEEVQKTIRKATFAACSECAAKHKDPTLTAMTRECLEAQHPQILTDCGKKARDFFTQLTDDHDIANVETVARPGNLTGPDGEDVSVAFVYMPPVPEETKPAPSSAAWPVFDVGDVYAFLAKEATSIAPYLAYTLLTSSIRDILVELSLDGIDRSFVEEHTVVCGWEEYSQAIDVLAVSLHGGAGELRELGEIALRDVGEHGLVN